jgi:hypothetical protein
MERNTPTLLGEGRVALRSAAAQTAGLLRSLRDVGVGIPGSEWTVRDAAVHLVTGTALSSDIATGMPSPVAAVSPETLATENAQRIADIPESDPAVLADLLDGAVTRLLDVTERRRGDEPVVWHGGRPLHLVDLVGLSLGEQVLHGHDMAMAIGRHWTIEPAHARLVAAAYAAVDEGEFQLAALHGRTSWTWD